MFKKIVLAVLLATSAYAQESSPTPTASSVVVLPTSTCLVTCELRNIEICATADAQQCICSNANYKQAIRTCLDTECPAEAEALIQFGDTVCNGVSSLSQSISGLSEGLSSLLSDVSSGASLAVSSSSSPISSPPTTRISTSVTNSRSSGTPSPTSTGSGGAVGLSVSFLATGGAVLLGVIGGGMLVF